MGQTSSKLMKPSKKTVAYLYRVSKKTKAIDHGTLLKADDCTELYLL